MANITIRNLPDKVHKDLKAKARMNRRSLNQEVIARLIAFDQETQPRETPKERMMRNLSEIKTLRSSMTRFMTAEEIDNAIQEGRA